MKNGWQKRRLRDVTTKIGSGATPLGGEAAYKAAGISLIRSLNVHDDGFRTKDLAFLDDNQAARLDNVIVEAGDVLLNITGASVARCCIVPNEHLPARVNQHVSIIRPVKQSLLPKFLHYMLISRDYKNRLLAVGEDGGSTRQAITKAQIQEFEIEFPSLSEQQRIVGLLDEAFAGIATAKATAEKNLRNARALFKSHLQSVFTQRGKGWKQKTLSEVATTFGRGKSRHRPRNAPHLYGGKYPFVQTGDIRNADHIITEYSQTYSESGLAQSKLWPKGTICITIAANIAETAILGFDACIPDSVIGVIANPKEAEVGFIEYLLQSFKARIQALGKGSAQANINVGTFENERFPFPSVAEQKQIVAKLDALSEETQRLASLYERKLVLLEALKKSLLHQAFTGELTKESSPPVIAAQLPLLPPIPSLRNITPINLHAGILAIGYQAYEQANRQWRFQHVVAEKFSHMTEALVGIDLGRNPVQDPQGPDDFPHLIKVEHRARMANYFTFRDGKKGKVFVKGRGFESLVAKTRRALGELNQKLADVIKLMLPMDMDRAEVVATVYAAWNNLLLDRQTPSDEQIVLAAREKWHPDKLKIPRENFFKTIDWIRKKNICPQGKGKKVVTKSV